MVALGVVSLLYLTVGVYKNQLLLFYPIGGPAHGKLFPGDQILQMNDEPTGDLSYERAIDILRYYIENVLHPLQNLPGSLRAQMGNRSNLTHLPVVVFRCRLLESSISLILFLVLGPY